KHIWIYRPPHVVSVPADVEIGGGYCGGVILYHGVVKVSDRIPEPQILKTWKDKIEGEARWYSDSALCFGPVSSSPLVLDLASDMRSLRDALLVVSGMKPVSCKKDEKAENKDRGAEGGVETETCTYQRTIGGEPGPVPKTNAQPSQ